MKNNYRSGIEVVAAAAAAAAAAVAVAVAAMVGVAWVLNRCCFS